MVIGPNHRFLSFGGLVAGLHNTISGPEASVSGGSFNTASGLAASVSGGHGCEAASLDSWSVGENLARFPCVPALRN